MITLTQITNTEIFAFIAVLVDLRVHHSAINYCVFISYLEPNPNFNSPHDFFSCTISCKVTILLLKLVLYNFVAKIGIRNWYFSAIFIYA